MPYFKGTRKFLRALLRLKKPRKNTEGFSDKNKLKEDIRVLEEELYQRKVTKGVVITCIVVGTVGLGVSLVLTGGTITIPIAISIAFLSCLYGSALWSLVYDKCIAIQDHYANIEAELTQLTFTLNQMV